MIASELKPGFKYAWSAKTNRALVESLSSCDITVLKGPDSIQTICHEELNGIAGDDWVAVTQPKPTTPCKWTEGKPDRNNQRLYQPACGEGNLYSYRFNVAGFTVCPFCTAPIELEKWDDKPKGESERGTSVSR